MKIIQATLADIQALTSIFEAYRKFYRQAPNPEAAAAFLTERITREESVIFIAKNDKGDIIGFTQLYPSFTSTRLNNTWILNDLYVDIEHRGQGISKALIDRAKQHAIQTKAHGLMLETEKDNRIANQLYLSTDFKKETNNFYFWTVKELENEYRN